MVWLVQNCRSNKCLIPKIPRASGGKAPLGPLPGFYSGPAGDLKRSPDPSPTHAPPNHKSWIRPWLQWIYSNTLPKNKKIKRADQILPEVHGTTLREWRKQYNSCNNMAWFNKWTYNNWVLWEMHCIVSDIESRDVAIYGTFDSNSSGKFSVILRWVWCPIHWFLLSFCIPGVCFFIDFSNPNFVKISVFQYWV